MAYTTQIDAARKGIVTREMEIVAKKERKNITEIGNFLAEGKMIIPANKNHLCLDPEGIGQGLRTKINVNLGISKDCCNFPYFSRASSANSGLLIALSKRASSNSIWRRPDNALRHSSHRL